jgi:hypothetical protein
MEKTEEGEKEGEIEQQVVMTQAVPAVTLNLRVQTQGTRDVTTAAAYADKRKLLKARCRLTWTRWKPYLATEQRAVGATRDIPRPYSPANLRERPKMWTASYASVRMSSSSRHHRSSRTLAR